MNFYLIDGNSYIYRAYYAIKGLSNSKGLPTNAIYGFTNMLLKIIREKKPDNIVVSFDSPVPTERHKIFEEYKAQRPEMPADLVLQIPHIRNIISSFNIKIFEIPGYEADDILGTIAKRASDRGIDVFIVSGDKDMLQLVDEKIKIYDPMKDKILNGDFIKERFGISADRMTDFMALTGDAIDNIPGIKGVGEKTARELLSEFKDLEEILNNIKKIKKNRLKSLLLEKAEIAKLSKKLATIDTTVPVDINIEEFRLKEPDWQSLLLLFKDLEFGSLIKLIPTGMSANIKYETILTQERVKDIAQSIKDSFSFTIESTSKLPLSGSIIGLALCKEKGHGLYIPVSHKYPNMPEQLKKKEVLEALSNIFQDNNILKIGHNIKFDLLILKQEGIQLKGEIFDTMIASYLLNPNKLNHNLEEVALEHLSIRKQTHEEIIKKRQSFSAVPIEEATPFMSENAHIIFELKDQLYNNLKEKGLETVYYDIEIPLIYVLADMEESGVKIDLVKLKMISKELEREMEMIQRKIYFLAGEEFNINSPKQLSRVLFHNLGFQPKKKTKTGYSTGISVLEELAISHELPREILSYRSLNKLKTTYIDVLPKLINPKTGRIHTSFNQTATATGRLSSSDPNLQNIPIRGEWGKRIREAFTVEKGNLLLSADYSQIELRILAHLSKDTVFIDSFKHNLDIHARTASEIFHTPIDSITPEMRRIAKTVNFGVIYGISPFGLSETLGISRDEAKNFIDKYFERHHGIKNYIEKAIEEAKRVGYVKTIFGRIRPIPEIKNSDKNIRQQGERLAINSPIQGTAADIIKIAMINIWRKFKEKGLKTKMILQIHDELLFELPEQELDIIKNIVIQEMEGPLKFDVPLRVDIKYGNNWSEVH